jgi:hypothetical protein
VGRVSAIGLLSDLVNNGRLNELPGNSIKALQKSDNIVKAAQCTNLHGEFKQG